MAKTKRGGKEAVAAVPETVDFREVLPAILKKVAGLKDLNAWKKAYPEVEFLEIDEGMSGKLIDWSSRKQVEMAAYVAYMRNPQMTEVVYEILADGYRARIRINDPERAWWMWLSGCFAHFDEENELSEDAQATLLHYAAQQAGDFEAYVEDHILPDDVELLSLEMKVKAL